MTSPGPLPGATPEPHPEPLHEYQAGDLTVEWRPARCIHSGRCVRALPAVFDPKRRPWIVATAAPGEEVAAAVLRCPSGALQLRRAPLGLEPPPA